MTADKHFKQLVRARMAATGERYSTARDHVRAAQADIVLHDPIVVDVHGRHGQTVVFTPDGTRLVTGGQDARVVVLDAATGAVEGELLGHDGVVNAVGVTADGTTVVSVSSDRTVRTWDLPSRSATGVLEGHRDAVVALALSPDGRRALTGGYDRRILEWSTHGVDRLREFPRRVRRVAALAYAPAAPLFFESGQGPVVHVRSSETGDVVAELDTGAPGVIGLAVAPDGRMLATGGYDGALTLWDCDRWEPVRRLHAGDRADAVAFSRSGGLVAAAARGRIVVWGPHGEEPVAETRLPIAGVYALAIAPDTRRLAQNGADGRVRIFRLR